ncbi:STAS domain-containing protein [Streptomyces sp. NPDC046939]|uniref:STAS domain-containing protein n=1 Tax=Streptomyces sp. NPDC046939 TaxID=3155376 RepID=UPI0033DEBC83
MSDPRARRPMPGADGARAPELRIDPLTDRAGLKVAGEICLPTHPEWERALSRLARETGDPVHLELSDVTFVDMAGATALAVTALGLGHDRRLVLDRPPPGLSRLLELFWPDLPAIEVAAV